MKKSSNIKEFANFKISPGYKNLGIKGIESDITYGIVSERELIKIN